MHNVGGLPCGKMSAKPRITKARGLGCLRFSRSTDRLAREPGVRSQGICDSRAIWVT